MHKKICLLTFTSFLLSFTKILPSVTSSGTKLYQILAAKYLNCILV